MMIHVFCDKYKPDSIASNNILDIIYKYDDIHVFCNKYKPYIVELLREKITFSIL